MDATELIVLVGQLAADNPYVTVATTVLPIMAPAITKLVHKHGSATAIIRWNKVRKIYRLGFMGKGGK